MGRRPFFKIKNKQKCYVADRISCYFDLVYRKHLSYCQNFYNVAVSPVYILRENWQDTVYRICTVYRIQNIFSYVFQYRFLI